MVVGGKGLSKEVMDGLEMLVDGEVAEVCRQAEQILLQGGDSGGEVDLDPAVRQVVFALITLVRTNKSLYFAIQKVQLWSDNWKVDDIMPKKEQ